VSYLVLARKYRPQSFEDLVGQEHVARTLANAIASGRVAHAFLFTGVRGVGKTTSARLLAKCLNCVGPDGKQTGPTATPCQVCAPCKEIANGSDLDVQEIDGASYNGVDEVRRLQEGIAFRPARDRYKIYIVDEVHMLSNAAWNAFLKTLEEPPPHVKFIFATTEVHKVPVTILSRCQRYDFKLIGTQTIGKRLRDVLAAEKIAADDIAVATLAREAAGSMRDAMSLLDQVIAFSGDRLSGEDVARVLGVADRKILHELAAGIVKGDPAACLRVVEGLAGQGFDPTHVSKELLRHLRDLVVAKVCGASGRELLDLADEEVKDVQGLAASTDADDLTRLFQGFSKSFDDIVKSGQPRAALEMTLVRLARRPPLLPLDELLARLGDLEKRLGGAPPPPPRTGGHGPSGDGPRSPGPLGDTPKSPGGHAQAPSTAAGGVFSPAPVGGHPQTRGALALAVDPAPAFDPDATTPTPPPTSVTTLKPAARPEPPAAGSPGGHPQRPGAPEGQRPGPDLDAWRVILDRVRVVKPALASVFAHGIPLDVSPARVLLGFAPDSFLGAQAAEAESLDVLTREVRAHFSSATQVALDVSTRQGTLQPSIFEMDAARRTEQNAKARAAVESHPLVVQAMAVLGAELKDVRLPPDPSESPKP
jgi:DNA polymerase III subunit gamma/tau